MLYAQMHWILKRLVRYLFTIGLVIHLSYFLIQFLPGGPIAYVRASLPPNVEASEEQLAARLNIDPDATILEQYQNWITDLIFHQDLGMSLTVRQGTPVGKIIAEVLPWTIFLMISSVLIAFSVGIVLGAAMAYFEGSKFDTGTTIFSIVMSSIPYYIFGVLLVFTLGYQMELFPTNGRVGGGLTPGLNIDYMGSVIYHATLPALSWALFGLGGWALNMRGNSIRVLGEDYMRVGRLRGLSNVRLTTRYVARNAILPLYTQLLIVIGTAFGGAVILEQIFVYRGLGKIIYDGAIQNDYPVMMGGFIVVVVAIIAGVFMAELTYGRLDPRAGEGGESEAF
jgi:peptide/nickel transport system permease protein